MSFQYRRLLYIAQLLSKSAITRQKIGDKLCTHFKDEMSNYPRRTFYADKDLIERTFEVEVLSCRKDAKLYYYVEQPLKIPESPITPEDMPKIRRALSLLKQLEGLPQSAYLNDILVKLESYNSFKGAPSEDVVSFEYPKLTGLQYLSALYEAIIHKKTLTIFYKPYETDQKDRARLEKISKYNPEKGYYLAFHTYYLKEFNKRWFILGYTEGTVGLTCLALDRITDLNVSFRPYIQNEIVDFKTYFNDIIGVTHWDDTILETFKFRVHKPRAYYVRTKPWHSSQTEIEETDENINFQYRLRFNRELEARVLEFGKDICVIAPAWFKAHIANILKEAATQY